MTTYFLLLYDKGNLNEKNSKVHCYFLHLGKESPRDIETIDTRETEILIRVRLRGKNIELFEEGIQMGEGRDVEHFRLVRSRAQKP